MANEGLGSSSAESDELQEEEVWTHQPAAPEEEAQIDVSDRLVLVGRIVGLSDVEWWCTIRSHHDRHELRKWL